MMPKPLCTLPACGEELRVQLSGAATLCRLVQEALVNGRSALVIAKSEENAAEIRSLLPLFGPEASGETSELLPSWEKALQDLRPLLGQSKLGFASHNLAALYALTRPTSHCLVTTLEALLIRQVPLDFFAKRVLGVRCGEEYALELICEQLVEWGYQRMPMVAGPGDFAVRGDILDLFPPGLAKPVRLEFFGDNLEEIRLFDAETQRSKQNIEQLEILPVTPNALTAKERDNAKARLETLARSGRISDNASYSIRKALDEGNSDLLPAVLFEGTTLLEDWLPKETVCFLPEEAELVISLLALRENIRLLLEAEEQSVIQPAALVLRKPSSPQAWGRFARVVFSDCMVGDQRVGEKMPEQNIPSLEALFPEDVSTVRDRPWQALLEGLKKWQRTNEQIILSFNTVKGRAKFLHLAEQDGLSPRLSYSRNEPGLYALVAPYRKGLELVWAKIMILGEDILFPKARRLGTTAKRAFKGLSSFNSIKEGDLLVHRDYGIGRFGGLHRLTLNQVENDFLLIEYAGHDKLYVPADNLALIQRYVGGEGAEPRLDRLGGAGWHSSREKARKAIEKIAADLVEMYAYRKVTKGFHYGPLSDLYHEFEATFDFEETPDQARAIQEVL
ncbi:MAG: transcription-repair coupling factor, partial [Desulfovibrio sp.]|nr:transcription-repair coupling factor [Desulfovibrio sp.]